MSSIREVYEGFGSKGRLYWPAVILFSLSVYGYSIISQVVPFMGPIQGTWCVAPNYVQARFHGYKLWDWRPVAGSINASAQKPHGFWDEVYFEFVDDKTPYSSKARGFSDFGVWRWYEADISSVRMWMRHTDRPRDPDTAAQRADWGEVVSKFGVYDVPEGSLTCPDD